MQDVRYRGRCGRVGKREGCEQKSQRRSARLVHIRRKFVDAQEENKQEAMWFIGEIKRLFSIEHEGAKRNLQGQAAWRNV